MPKIMYERRRFRADALAMIHQANRILTEYEAEGYDLTLRQLYYQFVARDLIPNRQSEYKRLGGIVNDARLAGYIDWNHIVDRTRFLRTISTWDNPAEIIEGAARGYTTDKWADQPYRVEVWVEKDALVGVIERAANAVEVPYLSCRGYTSQSEMWGAAGRLMRYMLAGQKVVILHLGDHDPSGIDMTRDIEDRLSTFMRGDYLRARRSEWTDLSDANQTITMREMIREVDGLFRVDRIALNRDQVDEYDPPPNPAKLSDSRSTRYVQEHGDYSWELDALPPTVLGDLIQNAVVDLRDEEKWEAASAQEEEDRWSLTATAKNWPEVVNFLQTNLSDDDLEGLAE